VRENDMSVVEFDREGRAWKDLFDAAVDLQRRFFEVFGGVGFGSPGIVVFAAVASSDNVSPILRILAWLSGGGEPERSGEPV
jgi:hypothetical protein